MPGKDLVRIKAQQASEVCRTVALDARAAALLSEAMTPGEYLDRLIGEACYADAVMFLAHALPKRQAVWWACLCGRAAQPSSAKGAAALEAAEAWVLKPTEENARRAAAVGEAAGTGSPAGWCALAAFWSGDNIAPEGMAAPVAPGAQMTGAAVAAAVTMAAVQAPPEQIEDGFRRCLTQGLDIAAGGTGRPKAADVDGTVVRKRK